MLDHPADTKEFPLSPDDARRHLEQMLSSPTFARTKRHSRFLRYVVDRTLTGHAQEIKERTLGIEIFDRRPDYNLSDDPIVRVTAGDIRRRLQQYYREEGAEELFRLELPVGSYVPTFRNNPQTVAHAIAEPLKHVPAPNAVVETPGERKSWRLPILLAFGTLLGLAAVFLGGFVGLWTHNRAERDLNRFWAPVAVADDQRLLFVVGDLNALHAGPFVSTPTTSMGSHGITGPGNVHALAEVANYTGWSHQRVQASMADGVTLSDLRAQPSVLIGAFDNVWTKRLLDGMRFTMNGGLGSDTVSIVDGAHPESKAWEREAIFETSHGQDFALITRRRSPLTGQYFVSISGVGSYGTVAAAEFVTHADYFSQFARQAPAKWWQKDIQIVLAVSVFDGRTSPPRMIASSIQ